jgi:hypothetical protein
MGANHRGIEHLHQMCRRTERGQMIEEHLKHAGFAQPVEPLPDAVPFAEAFRQRPPGDVVDREIMQRFQKQPVVPTLGAAPRQRGPKYGNCCFPILLRHPRGSAMPTLRSGHADPPNQSAIQESH